MSELSIVYCLCALCYRTRSMTTVTLDTGRLTSWCSLRTLFSGSPPAAPTHRVVTPWTPAPSSWSTSSAGTPWTCLRGKELSLLCWWCFIKPTWCLRGNTQTMYYGKGQDAPRARASDPVKELPGRSTGLFLQSDQHLDQHEPFDTSTIQTQQSVHPAEEEIKYQASLFLCESCNKDTLNNNYSLTSSYKKGEYEV